MGLNLDAAWDPMTRDRQGDGLSGGEWEGMQQNADGQWQTELDMSSLVSGATYQLLVTGTDAQGNPFEDLQLIPTFGAEGDDSISPWVWVIGLALLAGVIALLLWLVSRNQDSEEPGGDGGTITAASGTAVAADDAGADTIVMDELPDEDPGGPGAEF